MQYIADGDGIQKQHLLLLIIIQVYLNIYVAGNSKTTFVTVNLPLFQPPP